MFYLHKQTVCFFCAYSLSKSMEQLELIDKEWDNRAIYTALEISRL